MPFKVGCGKSTGCLLQYNTQQTTERQTDYTTADISQQRVTGCISYSMQKKRDIQQTTHNGRKRYENSTRSSNIRTNNQLWFLPRLRFHVHCQRRLRALPACWSCLHTFMHLQAGSATEGSSGHRKCWRICLEGPCGRRGTHLLPQS